MFGRYVCLVVLLACGRADERPATPDQAPARAARFTGWRGAELATFERDQVVLEDNSIVITSGIAAQDTDGRYHGGVYRYGVLASPVIETATPFVEAIASWEASTPPGSWIQIGVAARVDGIWTKEYVLGVWSSASDPFPRHSVNGQRDANGDVLTDTLTLLEPADAYRLTARLFMVPGARSPRLWALGMVTTDGSAAPPLSGDAAARGRDLAVPMRSQVIYPDGGEVWCSPTSTSMVLAYWSSERGVAAWNETVPAAAAACFDSVYEGTGNWSFNTAHAASIGDGALRAIVTRPYGLEQLEHLIAGGFPIVISASWESGGIRGAAVDSTNGHLIVVRGFDANGNVIVNDPAGKGDANVRFVYDRAELDAAWARSGRSAYVIHPIARPLPVTGALGVW